MLSINIQICTSSLNGSFRFSTQMAVTWHRFLRQFQKDVQVGLHKQYKLVYTINTTEFLHIIIHAYSNGRYIRSATRPAIRKAVMRMA
jgi:hypothetical protein